MLVLTVVYNVAQPEAAYSTHSQHGGSKLHIEISPSMHGRAAGSGVPAPELYLFNDGLHAGASTDTIINPTEMGPMRAKLWSGAGRM